MHVGLCVFILHGLRKDNSSSSLMWTWANLNIIKMIQIFRPPVLLSTQTKMRLNERPYFTNILSTSEKSAVVTYVWKIYKFPLTTLLSG
jgi:hypothetical protein